MNKPNRHPTGESENAALVPYAGPVPVDTFGGRVHVEWDPQAAVTPLGQLPFFTEFLQVSGLFDPWVESCPLFPLSPAPTRRASGMCWAPRCWPSSPAISATPTSAPCEATPSILPCWG